MTEAEPQPEPRCAKIALTTLLAVEQDTPQEIHPDSISVTVATEGLPKTEINRPNAREVAFGCAVGHICEFSFSVCKGKPLTPPSAPEQRVCVEDLELSTRLDGLMEAAFGKEGTKRMRTQGQPPEEDDANS